jgi:hypothetical protein
VWSHNGTATVLSDALADSMFAFAVSPPATDHDANWRDCLRL